VDSRCAGIRLRGDEILISLRTGQKRSAGKEQIYGMQSKSYRYLRYRKKQGFVKENGTTILQNVLVATETFPLKAAGIKWSLFYMFLDKEVCAAAFTILCVVLSVFASVSILAQ
jgi:hypothetical protein